MRKKIFFILPLAALLLLVAYTMAYAAENPTINRLSGDDRYETACAIAKAGWTQADNAVIAYGQNYPDALAAVPLAQKLGAPILLTNNDSLNAGTLAVLQDLQVKQVYLIGGTGVISAVVENRLTDAGYSVKRLAGEDRYDTSVKIAEELGTASEVAVTTGNDYADALSMGPIAAEKQIPIILVPKDKITDSIQAYLSSGNITKTYIVGDSELISDNVADQFSNVERITGQDKYARNVAILNKFADIYQNDKICSATGENFADALAGAVYAAKDNGAILLVKKDLPAATKSFLQNLNPTLSRITVFGGEEAVSSSLFLSASDNTINSSLGIEIVQGSKSFPVNDQNGELTLAKSPFSLRFNLPKTAQGLQIAALKDESVFKQEIANSAVDAVQYFNPGTSYAGALDKPYDSLIIGNIGHHYIYYENSSSNRADLVQSFNDYNRLEWPVQTVTIIPSDLVDYRPQYNITDVPVSQLYLVFFCDKNLNNLIDPDEYVKLKIKFPDSTDQLDYGYVEGQTYTNAYFGLKIDIPAGMSVDDNVTLTKGLAENENAESSGAPNNSDLVLLSLSNITAKGYCNFISVAEKINANFTNVDEYLTYSKGQLVNDTQFDFVFPKDPYTVNIGGKEFKVLEYYTKSDDPVRMYGKMYSTIANGYALSFNEIYSSGLDMTDLNQILSSIQISR
jgi:putative cell wall-binding protein